MRTIWALRRIGRLRCRRAESLFRVLDQLGNEACAHGESGVHAAGLDLGQRAYEQGPWTAWLTVSRLVIPSAALSVFVIVVVVLIILFAVFLNMQRTWGGWNDRGPMGRR